MKTTASNKKATINDVATLANVGKTSVSRYLNGEFAVLSESMQTKIAHAIEVLNYQPSQIARSMKRGHTKLIALIFADITNPYSIDVMQGIEAASREYGYTLLVFNTNNEIEREKHILQLLFSYQVEGVIIHALRTHDRNFKQFSLPTVSIDRQIHDLPCDVVGLDNDQASTAVTRYLLDSGFEAMLFVTETIDDIQPRQKRTMVFKQMTAEHPHCIGEVIELNSSKNQQQLDSAISKFCSKHRGMRKAIIAVNGAVTLDISLALKRLKLEWGRDIGLIGFDDPIWASVVGVGITTLKQPTFQIGYTAFQLLYERIHGNSTDFRNVFYPGELIVRESTE
ncbi:LacI family transcriptional regulator [Chelonobacter oris]|uniref:LacI family DNA-binding transcriptional regulator n=1 Tax=Chelonobacter oris TaxID=505317 RepID=UPI00244C8AE7|nr:LacI family DNA-binding transcriptional regulator [Chelonobacter oris]MDH3001155.1 LacI family transcriptional regulator [Chelonobacter oris]